MARAAVVALVLVAGGCTDAPRAGRSAAPVSTAATGAGRSPMPVVVVVVVVSSSPTPGGCGGTPALVGGLPEWTQSAAPPNGAPYVMSHEGNVVGVLFGNPLAAPPRPQGPTNKILWIVREPRNGSGLRLTLRPTGSGEPAVTVTERANSWPGEIYPSIVDVPAAGCWTVVAEWDGHRATLELAYV